MVASFELKPHQFQEAWTWIFGQWFPESGYQPADGQPFEMYSKEPENGICPVDICIPVKPL
jgi:AraC family transcriptional regulator